MFWMAIHGRPAGHNPGVFEGFTEIFRQTRFLASDVPEAERICEAIAAEVLVENGPPVAAVLDTEENWDNG